MIEKVRPESILHNEIDKTMFFFEGHAFRNGFLETDACRSITDGIRCIDEALCEGVGGDPWRPRDWYGIARPEAAMMDERGPEAALRDGISYLLWRLACVGSDRAVAYLPEYAAMVRVVTDALAEKETED